MSGLSSKGIDPNQVLYGNFQKVSALSLVGNPTVGLANTQAIGLSANLKITAGNLNTIQNIQTTSVPSFAGVVLTSSFQYTVAPTAGYVLTSDSLGNGTWAALPGGSGVTTIGGLDGGTANANAASISGVNLFLQSASVTYAGVVNTTTQSFLGAKTFTTSVSTPAFKLSTTPTAGYVLTSDASGNATWQAVSTGGITTVGALDAGTINANVLSISGSTIYIQSASATEPGVVNTASQSFAGTKTFSNLISSGNIQAATLKITTTPTSGYVLTSDASGNATWQIIPSSVNTIGALDGGTANANGATITGVNLYLQSASASFAGLVNTSAQTFAGTKTFSNIISSGNVQTATFKLTTTPTAGYYLTSDATGNGSWTVLPAFVNTIGALDGAAPSANAARITGNNLYLQSASATDPGVVNLGSQTFTGDKTFATSVSTPAFQLSTSPALGDVLLSDASGNASWASGFTPAQTPTQNQYYYVSGTSGNDVTGDGTYNLPFATVAKAMSLITTAGSNNRFIIKILGSKLQEPTNIVLKPWVYVVGDHADGTYIRINGGAGSIVPDAGFVTGRCGFQNIYFGGGTSVNWDLFSIGPNIGTPSCVMVLENVTITGAFTYKGRTPGIDFLESYNCYLFGTVLIDACQNNSGGTTYQGATTLSATNGLSNSFYQSCAFLTGLTVSASATYTNGEQFAACSINGGNLTINDAASFITLISDSVSYPKHANVTITGTPSISFLSDTYSVNYTPTTSANWSTVPTSAQQGLDDLATSGIYKTQTANTLFAGPISGGAALPTFRAIVTADIPNNIVTNAQLAQMPTLTIKGNNTGGTANALDLTTSQVTAMLLPFVGDSGAGGTQGLVPAPASGTTLQGDFLSSNGTFKYIDQSKPDSPSFSLVTEVSNPFALAKINNVLTYTGVNGKNYGVTIGAVASTLTFYDITNQSAPTYLSGIATLQGAFNAAHAVIGGIDYIIVASTGGFNLYIINASNPSLPTITTTFGLGAPTGSIYNVVYQNGYVYLACQSVGLKVVDIGGGGGGGTLLAPVVTFTQGAAKSLGVAISGTNLYTTQYSTSPYATRLLNSWTLTGLGSPTVPSLVQSLVLPGLGETLAVSINATTAFISNTTGVQQIDIVDITTPSAMTNITSISMPGGYQIASAMVPVPYGNYLFMPIGSHATLGGSILMYDITNRASPILVSTVSNNVATSPFGGISILGQYIFAGNYGPAPGSLGTLDVFTLPLMAPVIGTATASQLVLQNSFQLGSSTTSGYVLTANASGVGTWQAIPSSVSTIGALDGGTINANVLSITGNTLYIQSASATQPGVVNTSAQSFAGTKTFSNIISSGNVQTATFKLTTAPTAGYVLTSDASGNGTWAATGASGVTTIGSLDGGTANANSATITGVNLFLQSASVTYAGLVNITTQSFSGAKTFTTSIATPAFQLSTTPTNGYYLTCDASGNGAWTTPPSSGITTVGALDGGTTNANVLSISGSTIYIQSASATEPGVVNTAAQSFAGTKTFSNLISSGNVQAATLKITTTPTSGYVLTSDASGNASWQVIPSSVNTIGALDGGTANANGATITGVNLYLQSASTSFAGLVNTSAQTFAGTKTFSNIISSGNVQTATFKLTTTPTAGYILTSDASGNGSWAAVSSSGVNTVGALDGGTTNANVLSISGSTIYIQSASATEPGIMNTTTQSMVGAKTFTTSVSTPALKLSTSPTAGFVMTSDASGNASWAAAPSGSTPSVAANDVDTTFTSASNPNQLGCNPTAFRNYKLGSSFVAGNVFTFYNRATSWNNYCLVQANDGSAIAILPPLGRVSVTCLSTTPTTNTAWSLQDRESQWVNYSPSWGNFGTSSSVNVSAMLDFKSLKIRGYFQTGTLIVGLAYFSMPSGVAMDGTSGVLLSNTTSSNGSPLGTYGNGTTYNNFGYLISATGTDTTNIYWSASFANAVGSQLLPSGVGNVAGQGNFVGFIADVPILY